MRWRGQRRRWSLDDLFWELGVFERKEKPLKVKVFATFDYMGMSMYGATARKVARAMGPVRSVVWCWLERGVEGS